MARIPRIPTSVIDQIPKPQGNIFVQPPVVEGLEQPVINIPTYEPPTYTPPPMQAPEPQEQPTPPPVVPTIPTDVIEDLEETLIHVPWLQRSFE